MAATAVFAISPASGGGPPLTRLGYAVYRLGSGDNVDIRFSDKGKPAPGVCPVHAIITVAPPEPGPGPKMDPRCFVTPYDETAAVLVDDKAVSPFAPKRIHSAGARVTLGPHLSFLIVPLFVSSATTNPDPAPPLVSITPLWPGGGEGQPMHLAAGIHSMGTSPSCDVRFPANAVGCKPFHIALTASEPRCHVALFDESCATALNGKQVTFGDQHPIQLPSVIKLGGTRMRIERFQFKEPPQRAFSPVVLRAPPAKRSVEATHPDAPALKRPRGPPVSFKVMVKIKK
jgi:hypothetical protein